MAVSASDCIVIEENLAADCADVADQEMTGMFHTLSELIVLVRPLLGIPKAGIAPIL
jgi:hypothetical protein